MITIHRGAGMLVPILGILSALFMNIFTIKLFGDFYYREHSWPKLAVLLLAGASCVGVGLLLKKLRSKGAAQEQAYRDSFGGPRDHLMFIPVQYWSIAYFAAAIIYGTQIYSSR